MDLMPITLVRGVVNDVLKRSIASPKLLASVSAALAQELGATQTVLCSVDRYLTAASGDICQCFVNGEWLEFNSSANAPFMNELKRAQSIGSQVYIVYKQVAGNLVISTLVVSKPDRTA